jgi:5-bromo-4-chloroindolyl phosphate hydrolysis protein
MTLFVFVVAVVFVIVMVFVLVFVIVIVIVMVFVIEEHHPQKGFLKDQLVHLRKVIDERVMTRKGKWK